MLVFPERPSLSSHRYRFRDHLIAVDFEKCRTRSSAPPQKIEKVLTHTRLREEGEMNEIFIWTTNEMRSLSHVEHGAFLGSQVPDHLIIGDLHVLRGQSEPGQVQTPLGETGADAPTEQDASKSAGIASKRVIVWTRGTRRLPALQPLPGSARARCASGPGDRDVPRRSGRSPDRAD